MQGLRGREGALAAGRPDSRHDMMRARMGPADESEPGKAIRRYVTPDRRYLKLGGSLLMMSPSNRAEFTRKLGEAAGEISRRELDILPSDRAGDREVNDIHSGSPKHNHASGSSPSAPSPWRLRTRTPSGTDCNPPALSAQRVVPAG